MDWSSQQQIHEGGRLGQLHADRRVHHRRRPPAVSAASDRVCGQVPGETAMSAPTMPGRIIAPDDLTERDQWVLWRYEARNGKPTKVPYQVNARKASSTDPSTWTTFEAALDSLRQVADQFDGIGFVFTPEDPYCGIDLDDCIDDGGNIK